MKIGIMIFDGGVGGADAVVHEILKNIEYKDIVVITTNENYSYYENINGLKVISVGNLASNSLLEKMLSKVLHIFGVNYWYTKQKMKRYAKKVKKIIVNENINVIHAHLMQSILCLSYIDSSCVRIATIHDSHGLDKMGFDSLPYKETKSMFEKIDYVTSAVNYFFDLFENNNIHLRNARIIENGVNPKDYENNPGFCYDNNKFNIVFLGGDLVVKGCDYLAEAANIIKNKYNETGFCIHVLRNVKKSSQFYKYIEENDLFDVFDFVGYVSNGKHINYMKSSDLYVLPSRTEGAANTLLEAIGLNLCILATAVGGTPELVTDNYNGILCRCSADEIAQKVYELMKNPKLRLEISKRNCEMLENFSWKRIAGEYLDLYKTAFDMNI